MHRARSFATSVIGTLVQAWMFQLPRFGRVRRLNDLCLCWDIRIDWRRAVECANELVAGAPFARQMV